MPRRFQPSPDANAGCDSAGELARATGWKGFNPHPTRTPGATCTATRSPPPRGCVSTLTRRERRVRPLFIVAGAVDRLFQPSPDANAGCDAGRHPWRSDRPSFNPHPTRTPGATPPFQVAEHAIEWFQPSPDANAGCDWQWLHRRGVPDCFNPHPTRTPGATLEVPEQHAAAVGFQPSPDANAGCD